MDKLVNILKLLLFTFLLYLPCIIFSCKGTLDTSEPGGDYHYNIPQQIDDGWQTAYLADVGMDEAPLVNLMNALNGVDNHRIHSILIVRDGLLVFEEYFPGDKFKLARYTGEKGFDREDMHNLCSATKSFTSACVGIALDIELIQSVDQRVSDFFPEYPDIFADDPRKNSINLEHLLTMTSGLDWNDMNSSYFSPENDMYQIFNSNDPIKYMLAKSLIQRPGAVFNYQNHNTNILGEIVHKASQDRLDVFAEKYLFNKLGIVEYEWQMLPNNVVFVSGELRLRPRDMAKFGLLFLNEGFWKGEQIISSEWVKASTRKQIVISKHDGNWEDGYGYQWWCWDISSQGQVFTSYLAQGWGGQWILQVPELQLVIVITGGNYDDLAVISNQTIVADYIIPSIPRSE